MCADDIVSKSLEIWTVERSGSPDLARTGICV